MDWDLAQLHAFNATVREGTFEAAARVLHVTPSAISQRIKALEMAVGRVLLERSKPVRVTESGQVILLLARQVETLTADADRRLHGTMVTQAIPLAINADSLATWAMAGLAEISDRVSFEVFREDEERTTLLLREGKVMGAVTAIGEPVQGCQVTKLGIMRYRPLASPAFADKWFRDGHDTESLASAPIVIFDREDNLQDRYIRRFTRKRVDPPRTYIPSSADYCEAIRLGIGWGLVPDLQSDIHERNGELIDINPGSSVDVRLYWQQWKLSSDALDLVASTIRRHASLSLI